MNAVMISIHPKWVTKITNGKKTIEVRKTHPKLETPFKCYIYCTQRELLTKSHYTGEIYVASNKKHRQALEQNGNITLSGKVIGEFVCDFVYSIDAEHAPCLREAFHGISCDDFLHKSCLSAYELLDYLTATDQQISIEYNHGYGWHISDLKIYDKPLELEDFIHKTNGCANEGKCYGCKYLDYGIDGILEDDCLADFDTDSYSILRRAPQSWCYVMELKNNIEN